MASGDRPKIDYALTRDHLFVRYGRVDIEEQDLAKYTFGAITVSAEEMLRAQRVAASWHRGVNTALWRFSQGHWEFDVIRDAMAELTVLVSDEQDKGNEPWAAEETLALLTRIGTFDFGGPEGNYEA